MTEVSMLKDIAVKAKRSVELENYALWSSKPDDWDATNKACDRAFEDLEESIKEYESRYGVISTATVFKGDPVESARVFYEALCKGEEE